MADRRSMGAAMSLTPEKLAIHQQRLDGQASPGCRQTAIEATTAKTVEVELSPDPDANSATEDAARPSTRSGRRLSRGRSGSQGVPNADDVLSQLWMPLTTRLQHGTAAALRRATLEQRLRHATTDTQQEIIDIAVQHWLRQHGFLE